MNCPFCKNELKETPYSTDLHYHNKDCVAHYLQFSDSFWRNLTSAVEDSNKRAVERYKQEIEAPPAPRWRLFDLEEMRKSLPVIVTSRIQGMNYAIIVRNEDEIAIRFKLDQHNYTRELIWLPVPKVEVVE